MAIYPLCSTQTFFASKNSQRNISYLKRMDTNTAVTSVSHSSKSCRKNLRKSPCLNDNHIISKETENSLAHQSEDKNFSSCSLAQKIYRTNSDKMTTPRKINKKNKKSILTLPNESNSGPEAGATSDINEYVFKDNFSKKNKKCLCPNTRKSRIKHCRYDAREEKLYSQLDVDCSSTTLKYLKGDCRLSKKSENSNINAHDIWAMLRNMNTINFVPSPPMSSEITVGKRNKRRIKRCNTKKKSSIVKSCRTEEFTYISSITYDEKSPSLSGATSFDRLTIIEKRSSTLTACQAVNVEKENRMDLENTSFHGKAEVKNKNIKQKHIISKNKKSGAERYKKDCLESTHKHYAVSQGLEKNSKEYVNLEAEYSSHAAENHDCNKTRNINSQKSMHIVYNYENEKISALDSETQRPEPIREKIKKNHSDNDNIYSVKNGKGQQGKSCHHKSETVKLTQKNEEIPKSQIKLQATKRKKSRLVTTMPSTAIDSKLPLRDLKRQLALLKYPIVVLAKDQLSSSIEVFDYDPPHLKALNEQIWPYMLDWFISDSTEIINRDNNREYCKSNFSTVNNTSDCKSNNNLLSPRKQNQCQLHTVPINKSLKKSSKHKIITTDDIENEETWDLKIPQKKRAGQKIFELRRNNNLLKNNLGFSFHKFLKRNQTNQQKPNEGCESTNKTNKIEKSERTKSVCTNNFIEKIIKNINDGIYYNFGKCVVSTHSNTDIKQISTQTKLFLKEEKSTDKSYNNYMQDRTMISEERKNNLVEEIPGFDDAIYGVELKTIDISQILVRLRETNITVLFDLTLQSELNLMKPKTPLICFSTIFNNHEKKVLKCKTTITNSMLPAELCIILPKIMEEIKSVHSDLTTNLHEVKETLITSSLSSDPSQYCKTAQLCVMSALGFQQQSISFHGTFSITKTTLFKKKTMIQSSEQLYKDIYLPDLLPCLSKQKLLHSIKVLNSFVVSEIKYYNEVSSLSDDTEYCKSVCNNTELQPYRTINRKPISILERTLKLMTDKIIYSSNSYFLSIAKWMGVFNLGWNRSYNIFNATVENKKSLKEILHKEKRCILEASGSDLFIKILCMKQTYNVKKMKCIELLISNNNKSKHYANKLTFRSDNHSKIQTLTKKCKSVPDIPKRHSSLADITNIDDFFKLLGLCQTAWSVFNDEAGRKILSCILEMKNWTKKINAKQGMLVLLLTNKKDTPSLVRFRSLILQDIAENRITQANELDMKVDLIEKEIFNKQYEGSSLLSAVDTQGHLLEELHWIAKTTAYENKKPFDMSSERLLESLMHRKKKLNPSYLRVMARYVGLGLVKPLNNSNCI